ncbi:type II toxin-antitoxin system HicA family toxin [Desulfobotulus sp. H1]|uniref:Type II toxin-antitoxin system HicA family toxin n=1 Tax=Desulfobotulus pelophilus TaxID=2823377 RepID=A0ABT3ND75_9BACT|nr:type II toxin-antitoxin system HicA family toxin [Desulfobotulus pelophilus]MCW7755370.1 type II toxin-antitoxin system HicA family toxin [Desulfobotulus pelophilus]
MGKKEKLLQRLHSRPKDFTWDELVSLLKALGFEIFQGRGSRCKFIHKETQTIISLHRPHPGNELKMYVMDQVIEKLSEMGVFDERSF